MIGKLLLKLCARDDVSAREEGILGGAVADIKDVAEDVTVVRADRTCVRSSQYLLPAAR